MRHYNIGVEKGGAQQTSYFAHCYKPDFSTPILVFCPGFRAVEPLTLQKLAKDIAGSLCPEDTYTLAAMTRSKPHGPMVIVKNTGEKNGRLALEPVSLTELCILAEEIDKARAQAVSK